MSTSVQTRGGRHAKNPKRAAVPAPPPETSAGESRWNDWKSSWRIALRMARRDLRRHKGRSAVVALMVGVPLLVLSFLVSFGWSTLSTSATPERLMGSAAAWVTGPVEEQILQDGSTGSYIPVMNEEENASLPAEPIPGFDSAATPAENAAAIGAVTGGTATPLAEPVVRVAVSDRTVGMQTLALDGSTGFGDKAQLLSGRWPSGPTEALVTEPGMRKGLPASGTFEVLTGDTTVTVTVTGTATGVLDWGMIPHLISAEPLGTGWVAEAAQGRWLITGTDAPFSTVSELGTHGLIVQSAELMRTPVPRDQLPPGLQVQGPQDTSMVFFWLTAGIILALVIALLVAPAFAVSASRQRHTLALAASNGATTRQLRRTVLAQALILGVLAAVIGAAVGAVGAATLAYLVASQATEVYVPLVRVPWALLTVLVLIAVVSAVTAALVPARRLGRLDIMGVLKGQNVSAPPSRVLPVVGAVVMAVSALGLLWGARQTAGGDFIVAFAAIGLVAGALSLIPITLVAIGKAGAGLPVSVRMATRDAARQRARSVPTVAAVMGGVAALTIGLIAGTSDAKEAEASYLPRTVMGQGLLQSNGAGDPAEAAAIVRERLPGASVVPLSGAGTDWNTLTEGPLPYLVLAPPGCSAERAVYDEEHFNAQQAAFEAAEDREAFVWEPSPCEGMGGPASGHGDIMLLPAAVLVERLELSDEQAERARTGAVFVRPGTLTGESVAAFAGTYVADEMTVATEVTVSSEAELPLVVLPAAASRSGALFDGAAALVATEAAEANNWPVFSRGQLIDAPDGIDTDDEQAINDKLEDAELYVERGWQDDTSRFFAVLVAGVAFILLVVILTATALSMAEQRRDDSTLAAVGATRGTRRAIAAAQAGTVSVVGAVLGLVVGLVPGVALAYPLTRSSQMIIDESGRQVQASLGPFVEIPYAWLALVAIGVPVLAAVIAALAVRRAPVVTRRAS